MCVNPLRLISLGVPLLALIAAQPRCVLITHSCQSLDLTLQFHKSGAAGSDGNEVPGPLRGNQVDPATWAVFTGMRMPSLQERLIREGVKVCILVNSSLSAVAIWLKIDILASGILDT